MCPVRSCHHVALLSSCRRRSIFRQCVLRQSSNRSASDKLFEDAAREEAHLTLPPRPNGVQLLKNQLENWTGDESIHDAVLRMLVDKHKPLRSGTIITAEEKLKQAPPKLHGRTVSTPIADPKVWANEPLLPAVEGHKPWLTTFKPPSHAKVSIRTGDFAPVSSHTSCVHPDKDRRKERETKKRSVKAERLVMARELTLDYQLGIKGARSEGTRSRANPVSLKGWQSLVEDKIQRARRAGQFTTVKGRGKPLVRETNEGNPFIAREEFLMNRIVQRNGAAPPWVEVQGELDSAITSFREILRQSWIRRAIRTLTISGPPVPHSRLTLADITSLRDKEWESHERTHHDAAIENVNCFVRKYNGVAPYAVRRPYCIRSIEVERVYKDCAEDILQGVAERMKAPLRKESMLSGHDGAPTDATPWLGILDVIRQWLARLLGR